MDHLGRKRIQRGWPWLAWFQADGHDFPSSEHHPQHRGIKVQGCDLLALPAARQRIARCYFMNFMYLHVTTVSGPPNGWDFINLRFTLVLKNISELLYNNDLQLGSRHFGSHCSHLLTSDAGTQTATMTAFQSALISNCPHCTSPVVGSSSNTSSCPVRIKRSGCD